LQEKDPSARVSKTVALVHAIDPSNETFRYSRKYDGVTPTVTKDIDVDIIAQAVRDACEDLERAHGSVWIIIDQLREYANICAADGDYYEPDDDYCRDDDRYPDEY
jgi:hypothetical protein